MTRKNLNISQYKLSHLSGISERYLNFLEHGKVEPRIMTVVRIAKALDIPPGELVNPLAYEDNAEDSKNVDDE